MIKRGDCLVVLPTLEADSVDACVTDPPYGLAFMGKEWDDLTRHAYRAQEWHERWAREVYRVLKPGAYLLAFGGTRTFHRLACAIEDAGLEVRDCLCWLYGSGFPKSLDVSRALDRAAGAEPIDLGPSPNWRDGKRDNGQSMNAMPNASRLTAPATDAARLWVGWGTALKPGWEPIVMARKPLRGTVAANVQQYGTGAINVDGCRIDSPVLASEHRTSVAGPSQFFGLKGHKQQRNQAGRWPANVCLDEAAAAMLDEQSGELAAGVAIRHRSGGNTFGGDRPKPQMPDMSYGDSGGASRFFFVAERGCALCDAPTDGHGIMSAWRNTSVSSVGRSSRTIHQTLVSIAPAHVQTSLIESIALRVPYVESLCDRCATRIALALVEIKHSGSKKQASAVFQGCTPESKSSILTRSLASFAGLWESTDTIPTTESLSLLCGSVLHAIGNSTNSTSPASDNAHARFLYSAKPSREERDLGCDGLPMRSGGELCDRKDGSAGLNNPRAGAGRSSGGRNTHPTVKPLALMRWLVRLVTPPSGVVLDPFTGSGTTGMACAAENVRFIGIEREAEYVAIAERRIAAIAPLFQETA